MQSHAINISLNQIVDWLLLVLCFSVRLPCGFSQSLASQFVFFVAFAATIAINAAIAVKDVDAVVVVVVFCHLLNRKDFCEKILPSKSIHSNCNHFLCDVICKLIKWRMSWPEQKGIYTQNHIHNRNRWVLCISQITQKKSHFTGKCERHKRWCLSAQPYRFQMIPNGFKSNLNASKLPLYLENNQIQAPDMLIMCV